MNLNVRTVTTWDENAQIILTGKEYEVVKKEYVNMVNCLNRIGMIIQMTEAKHILNGTVKVGFEKLNPETKQFDPVEGKELEELKKQFDDQMEKIKTVNQNINTSK